MSDDDRTTFDQWKNIVKKSSLAGGVADGLISVLERKSAKDVARDVICGATTCVSGAVSSQLFSDYISDSKIARLAVGCISSVSTRYAFRSAFGPPPQKDDRDADIEDDDYYYEE